MGILLSRAMLEQLALAPPPIDIQEVPSPELGADTIVYVRTITSAACERYQRRALALNERAEASANLVDLESARIPLILEAVCDEHGNALFTADDAPLLETFPASVIYRWFRAAYVLNKIGEELTDVAEAKKNSASIRSNDSGTNWPGNGVAPCASAKAS